MVDYPPWSGAFAEPSVFSSHLLFQEQSGVTTITMVNALLAALREHGLYEQRDQSDFFTFYHVSVPPTQLVGIRQHINFNIDNRSRFKKKQILESARFMTVIKEVPNVTVLSNINLSVLF